MDARLHVKEKRVSNPGQLKSIIQRLGRGLMLPIAILPIAGLFLGIGAGINNALIAGGVTAQEAYIFGDVIKSIGDVVFANLPVLFAIAIAITFTSDAGAAALAAFVGWLVFNAIQAPMIGESYLIDGQTVVDISFYTGVSSALLTQNVGITSMNTSVFGAIVIGGTTAVLYNKFYKIKLPSVIGFFSGVRFIPIVVFVASALLGMLFIIIWPLISMGITAFGNAINSLPVGLNSFIFGITERALIPFGLHHVFYTPLWYTSAGASLDLTQIFINGSPINGSFGITDTSVTGDQSIWVWLNSHGNILSFNDVSYISHHLSDGAGLSNSFGDITWTTNAVSQNYQPGQYMQGKFTIMIFGLPAAGAAMIMAAKKEKRQVAMSVIGAAAFTSLLTGITEPIEFTFLFLAPILFFGFHVLMAGISFWVLNIAGAHIGLTFSGGLIDLVIYGVLPSATGNPTGFWIAIVLGLIYIPIYYAVFYTYIVKKDIPTPGRTDEEVKMFSKSDYQTKGETAGSKSDGSKDGSEELTRLEQLIIYLGGLDNLKTIDACATRLRLTVIDRDKILVNQLKGMGAAGVAGKGVNVQVIFGGEADIFKTELLEVRSGKIIVSPRVAQELDKLYGESDLASEPNNEITPNNDSTPSSSSKKDEPSTAIEIAIENQKVEPIIEKKAQPSKSKPKAKTKAKPKAEVKPEVKEETKVEPSKPEVKPEIKTEEKKETKVESKPEVKVEPKKVEPKKETAKTESKPEVKPEIKTEEKKEVKVEPKPEQENKVERKPEVKVEPKKETAKTESKPEVKPEIKTEEKKEVKVEPKPELKQETKVEPQPEIKPEVKVEPKPELKQETKVEPQPEIKPEVKVEPKPEPKKEVKTEKTLVKDFSKNKEKFEEKEKQVSESDQKLAKSLVKLLGGKSNIIKISSNITRISIKVNNRKDVDQEGLKAIEDFKDFVGNSNNFQIVWAKEVDTIAQAINELL